MMGSAKASEVMDWRPVCLREERTVHSVHEPHACHACMLGCCWPLCDITQVCVCVCVCVRD